MYLKEYVVIIFSLVILIGCKNNSPIVIDPTKSEFSQHLGKGVWLRVPSSFKKATSYDGYQMNDQSASISVKIVNRSLEEFKRTFEPDVLSQMKQELLEIRPVVYGDNEFAFYSKVRDKRKRTIKYLLAIANGAETYTIKAFCFQDNESQVGRRIEKALWSTYIGEQEDEKYDFLMARIYSADHIVFTKDGELPTKSKDEAIIEVKVLELDVPMSPTEGEEYLKNEISKIVPNRNVAVTVQKLIEGYFLGGGGVYDGRNVYLSLLMGNQETKFLKCTANAKIEKSYFEEFIKKKYLKTTVSYR